MKAKILKGTGYIGLDFVIGRDLEATFVDGFGDTLISITGQELTENGAMEGAFRDEGEYNFRVPESAIIVGDEKK